MPCVVGLRCSALVLVAALPACNGGLSVQPGPSSGLAARDRTVSSEIAKSGLYVGVTTGSTYKIYAYKVTDRRAKGPICTISGTNADGAVAADGLGDLMVPRASQDDVILFKGPELCGPELGTVADPYGQPSDAASRDARKGTIAIADIFGTSGAGSIAVCTLSGGCTKNLTNPNMGEVAGVAIDKDGNCYASSTTSSGTATLTYFKHCSGSGKTATGFRNSYYGGLDFDAQGHLLAISAFDARLYVYDGCRPACKLVGGPFSLDGESVFGHLNKNSTNFAAADFQSGTIDVYSYAPTQLTYRYSFGGFGGPSAIVDGAAYSPSSSE